MALNAALGLGIFLFVTDAGVGGGVLPQKPQSLAAWWAQVNAPAAGTWVLHFRVQEMIQFLQHNAPDGYRLSGSIFEDAYTWQRLIEGAWPVRVQPQAPITVGFEKDVLTPQTLKRFCVEGLCAVSPR